MAHRRFPPGLRLQLLRYARSDRSRSAGAIEGLVLHDFLQARSSVRSAGQRTRPRRQALRRIATLSKGLLRPWQPERHVLAGVVAAADRDDDVLLAVEHI